MNNKVFNLLYWAVVAVVVAMILGSMGYSLMALLGLVKMDWLVYGGWLAILVLAHTVMFWMGWLRRNELGQSDQLASLLWVGIVYWYWVLAPIFFYLVLGASWGEIQIDWLAFATFWEVVVIGGAFVLYQKWQFGRILKMESQLGEEDVPKLYDRVLKFPRRVAFLMLMVVIAGYVLLAVQMRLWAYLPVIDGVGVVMSGLGLSLLLSVFYRVALGEWLSKMRYDLAEKYGWEGWEREKFGKKLMTVGFGLVSGGVVLLSLLFLVSVRMVLREGVADMVNGVVEHEKVMQNHEGGMHFQEGREARLRFGEGGVVSTLSGADSGILDLMFPETLEVVRIEGVGAVYDDKGESKLVFFDDDLVSGEDKIVGVVYLADFYSRLRPLALRVVLVGALVFFGLAVIIRVVVGLFGRGLGQLVEKVELVKNGEDFNYEQNPDDEVGDLAVMINQSISQVKQLQVDLETKVVEQTGELEEARGGLEDQQEALLNILEDISEEKEVEEGQAEVLLSAIREGVVITNEKGEVKYMNPAFLEMMGMKGKNIEGEMLVETMKLFDMKGEAKPANSCNDDLYKTGERVEPKKVRVQIATGELLPIMIVGSQLLVNGKDQGVVRLIHDYSEEFKIQQQKDDFFSIASHELRTPLTVIAGSLDNIMQGYGGSKLSKTDGALIGDVMGAAERLIRMVNDFLNVSRLDQGRVKMELAPVSAGKLAAKIVEEIQPLVKEKGISLKLVKMKNDVLVMADEDRLREVVVNLIGNSLKFTKKGGITVTQEVEGEMLKTTVKDTGMGIAKDKQDLLFQRFQQAMNRTLAREAGGTGLGLYIIREFVKLMGGEMRLVKSSMGKGSEFAFTVPVAKKGAKKKIVNEEGVRDEASSKAIDELRSELGDKKLTEDRKDKATERQGEVERVAKKKG